MILLTTPAACDRIFVIVKAADHSVAAIETNHDFALGINNWWIGNDPVWQSANLSERYLA